MQRQQQMHESKTLMLVMMMKVTFDHKTIKWGEYVTNDRVT